MFLRNFSPIVKYRGIEALANIGILPSVACTQNHYELLQLETVTDS